MLVSYSRRDVDFADQLVHVLADRGFEVVIDRKDIDAAERWKERLGQLILQSDIIVFVLSPDWPAPTPAPGRSKRRCGEQSASFRCYAAPSKVSCRQRACAT